MVKEPRTLGPAFQNIPIRETQVLLRENHNHRYMVFRTLLMTLVLFVLYVSYRMTSIALDSKMVDCNQRMEGIWCFWEVIISLNMKVLYYIFYASHATICFLSDLVLSNKVVVYDLENQVIGWTDYNCKG
jgi:hypothetical protein